MRNEDFGYWTITVKRPLRDAADAVVPAQKGKLKGELQADAALHEMENVPLSADVQVYFERQVPPLVPDAWIDRDKTKVGYKIPFNWYFYVFEPPRSLAETEADLKGSTVSS